MYWCRRWLRSGPDENILSAQESLADTRTFFSTSTRLMSRGQLDEDLQVSSNWNADEWRTYFAICVLGPMNSEGAKILPGKS